MEDVKSESPALYLERLSLINFATFEKEEINFKPSFNTIVGETGSGKSLILDALQMVFGARSDKKLIRKDCHEAIVEATFQVTNHELNQYLKDIGHPVVDDEVVVKRTINSKGKSKAFLNFQQCSISTLIDFSKRYVDLVGQFENQKLLSADYQMLLVDSFANCHELKGKYQKKFAKLKSLEEKIQELQGARPDRMQKLDYLDFQLNELRKLQPDLKNEEKLIKRKLEILNAQNSFDSLQESIDIISENDRFNILTSLKKVQKLFSGVDISHSELINEKLLSLISQAEDLSFNISRLLNAPADQEELDAVVEELDAYNRLKRKFGVSTEELSQLKIQLENEFQELTDLESKLSKIEAQKEALLEDCHSLGSQLHLERSAVLNNLSEALTTAVQELNMKNATILFEAIEIDNLRSNGKTELRLMAETNPGEGMHLLKNIASGGELSRVLLALRQVLSCKDSISVFLFDEIDTGVGGETAKKIGESLSRVSFSSQVIAITHLSQIAEMSDRIIQVEKESEQKGKIVRTFSRVNVIESNQRDKMLSSMSSAM